MQTIINYLKKVTKSLVYIYTNIVTIIKSFSKIEKIIFAVFAGLFIISSLFLLEKINKNFLKEIPAFGGSLTEGIIGSPRFINPVLATSNADKDLSTLVYSGLLKATTDGGLEPDLAESYKISEDGYVYSFKLKDNLFFHDGVPLTTEDIEFTISATQNDIIKSPKRANWDGIEVKRLNDKEIQFILSQPYSPFLENLTLGILPKHIWGEISPEQFAFSQFNIEPIGSGPYKIDKIKRSSEGTLEEYSLRSYQDYSLGQPYITKINLKFYPDEATLLTNYQKNNFDSLNSVSPDKISEITKNKTQTVVLSAPLPRIFGVFFNQNKQPLFTNKEIRTVLSKTVDKKRIIAEVLNNYGIVIDSPIPPKSSYYFKTTASENVFSEKTLSEVRALLKKNGWKLNEDSVWEKVTRKGTILFSFSVSTANTPELKAIANILKENWEQLGAKVTLKIFEIGDLNQNVIRPRDYESLLFGEVIGRDMDLFAFWHSSQRNDPGLNVAMYTNITTDSLLEKIRAEINEKKKKEEFVDFQKEITNDVPAVFIYSPKFIYLVPQKVQNIKIDQITIPSERFLDVYKWYIETNKIWKFFEKNSQTEN